MQIVESMFAALPRDPRLWAQVADHATSAAPAWLWRMDGTNRTSGASLQPDNVGTTWRIAGTPDLTGDGQEGLLFQGTDGHLAVWFMNDIYRLRGTALAPGPVQPSSSPISGWMKRIPASR